MPERADVLIGTLVERFEVLSRLLIDGPSLTLAHSLRADLPIWAALEAEGLTSGDLINAPMALKHHREGLTTNMQPCASLFLDREASVGGPVTSSVIARYLDAGFKLTPGACRESLDHLGVELLFLSYLCRRWQRAHRTGDHVSSALVLPVMLKFLDEHLLLWIVPCLQAMSKTGSHVWAVVARSIAREISELCSVFKRAPAASQAATSHAAAMHDYEGVQHDQLPDVKELTTILLSPAICGMMVTRHELVELSNTCECPQVTGDRGRILAAVMKDGVSRGRLFLVIDSLQEIISTRLAELKHWELGTPASTEAWASRIRRTISTLTELEKVQRTRGLRSAVKRADVGTGLNP